METSALFGLARLLGHEAISCNVVLGNRITKTFLSDPYAHIDQMIATRLEQIIAL
jgi:uridine phosphorylase